MPCTSICTSYINFIKNRFRKSRNSATWLFVFSFLRFSFFSCFGWCARFFAPQNPDERSGLLLLRATLRLAIWYRTLIAASTSLRKRLLRRALRRACSTSAARSAAKSIWKEHRRSVAGATYQLGRVCQNLASDFLTPSSNTTRRDI